LSTILPNCRRWATMALWLPPDERPGSPSNRSTKMPCPRYDPSRNRCVAASSPMRMIWPTTGHIRARTASWSARPSCCSANAAASFTICPGSIPWPGSVDPTIINARIGCKRRSSPRWRTYPAKVAGRAALNSPTRQPFRRPPSSRIPDFRPARIYPIIFSTDRIATPARFLSYTSTTWAIYSAAPPSRKCLALPSFCVSCFYNNNKFACKFYIIAEPFVVV